MVQSGDRQCHPDWALSADHIPDGGGRFGRAKADHAGDDGDAAHGHCLVRCILVRNDPDCRRADLFPGARPRADRRVLRDAGRTGFLMKRQSQIFRRPPMAPKPESTAKLAPLGREFRGVSMAGAYTRELFWQAFKGSLAKFDPRVQIHNPVMFVVWVGALVTLALTIDPSLFGPSNASRLYNGVVTIVLALTVWFANYAEALAEGRGKAKAESLRQTRANLVGVRVRDDGRQETVPATELGMGDIVRVDKNDVVPADGEVVEGVAYVNESAITGEAAPG